MATVPEYSPEFAYLDVDLPGTGETNKLRPPVEIREAGYDYLQKLPAEELNWLLNNHGQWIVYLYELTRDQGITEVATKSQAEEGTANDVLMTPERVLDSIKYNAVPPGTVSAFAGSTAPTGYLMCNGQAVSRTTYSRLFAAIGTTWGSGDGSTTFNVPDARGEFIRGLDDGRGVDSGRTLGSSQDDAFQGHVHTGSTVYTKSGSSNYGVDSNPEGYSNRLIELLQTGYDSDGTNGTPRTADETRPRNIAMNYIIKY